MASDPAIQTTMSDFKEDVKQNVDVQDSTIANDSISVILNSTMKLYDRNVLMSFPYFNAKLSDRWNDDKVATNAQNTSKKKKYKEKNNLNPSNIVNNGITIGDNLPFNLKDFDTLIEIKVEGSNCFNKIYNYNLKQLECLLECHSYFGSKCINASMLKGFFEYVIISNYVVTCTNRMS